MDHPRDQRREPLPLLEQLQWLIPLKSSLESLAPSSVPGPIPLFGAAAAFGWSRQLRRRIKTPA